MKISSSWPSLSVGYKFWQNLSDIAGRMPAVPAPTNNYKKVALRSGFFRTKFVYSESFHDNRE